MRARRLNDATIAFQQILKKKKIVLGTFGGYAIGVLGGPRESKDVDSLIFASKEQVVKALDGKHGFKVVPQSREDYVAFLWSDHADYSDAVLLEFFITDFDGAPRYRAGDIKIRQVNVVGDLLKGDHSICLLDPFYIFKGKLRAAATRQKYHDAADLRWLESKYRNILLERCDEINIGYIGLALKKSPELEACFQRIGVDVEAAKKRVASVDLSKLPPPAKGDVLKGLLG